MIRQGLAIVLVGLAAGWAVAAPTRRLEHRIWLVAGVPDDATLVALRSIGVSGLVLPVGKAEIGEGSSRFTLESLPDLKALAGWSVTPVVWVEGTAGAAGDAAALAAQLAPVRRLLPGGGGVVLAARVWWDGLPRLALALSRQAGGGVEVALPATDAAQHLPDGGWAGVGVVALAFGNPEALALPASTVHDDLAALAALDERGVRYRVGIVVLGRAVPPPGVAGVSLGDLAQGEVASYQPGERGDLFTLRRAVDWGGTRLEAGRTIETEIEDTARYHRDLGLALRPVRHGLIGWDTVGLAAPEPTLGMSREAFLDYMQGGVPYPRPTVTVEALSPTALRVAVINPSPYSSAVATTGNWVELQFSGTEVRDVQLGEFSGVEYGRLVDGVFRGTVAGDADVVRLYVTYLAPRARLTGGVVFLLRPRSLAARWGLRLGDGSETVGPFEALQLTKP